MLYSVNQTTTAASPLKIASTTGTSVLAPETIVRMEAISNYTRIYFTNGRKMVVSKTLKHFASELLSLGFIRCHRTHLVNPAYIKRMIPGALELLNGELVMISRRKKNDSSLLNLMIVRQMNTAFIPSRLVANA